MRMAVQGNSFSEQGGCPERCGVLHFSAIAHLDVNVLKNMMISVHFSFFLS